MIPEEVVHIARKIGQFYLQKNDNDYEKAEKEIRLLDIQSILIGIDSVIINIPRPGLLIGRLAKNIDDLTKFLRIKIKIVETEDCLNNHLIPRPEVEMDDWEDQELNWIKFPSIEDDDPSMNRQF